MIEVKKNKDTDYLMDESGDFDRDEAMDALGVLNSKCEDNHG